MPRKLEEALRKSFARQKKRGKLKGVSLGQYVYGSEAMKKYMRKKRG